jgi:hypothetical protein
MPRPHPDAGGFGGGVVSHTQAHEAARELDQYCLQVTTACRVRVGSDITSD